MIAVSNCPSCGGEISRCRTALVSPFLARRIWGRNPFRIELMKCEKCDLMFFNPRLEPEEEGRHYSGYRDAEYQGMRQSVEPWYTPRFNANITNPDFLRLRKSKVSKILRPYLTNKEAATLLDFGGAHGELVQGLIPGASAYVYEVSGVEPLDGVGSCADVAACRNHKFDLIISSNVLEHVGSPRALVQEMRQIAGPSTMLWVEVPFESAIGPPLMIRRFMQQAILCLLRPKVALSQARPGMLYLMHEHVNFFTLKALEYLLRSAGWNFIASGKYDVRGPLGYQEFIWALGQISESGVSHNEYQNETSLNKTALGAKTHLLLKVIEKCRPPATCGFTSYLLTGSRRDPRFRTRWRESRCAMQARNRISEFHIDGIEDLI